MITRVIRKLTILGIIMLFIGTSIVPCDEGHEDEKNTQSGKQNLFSNWKYQTILTISPPTPASDFQIKITLETTKFDYSTVNVDGSDLRFADTDGNTLNYWIEQWNPTGTSLIWVKVLQAGTTSIVLYHGNTDASSMSNGDQTFVFFDDFFIFNASKWESWFGYEPEVSITNNGEIEMTEKYGGTAHLYSKAYIPIETRTRFRIKQRHDGPNLPAGLIAGLQNMSKEGLGDHIEAVHEWWYSEWRFCTGCNESGDCDPLSGINVAELSQYYIDEYIWTKGKAEYYYNWKPKYVKTTNITNNPMNLSFNICGENTLICDWVMVTRYSEEPCEVVLSDDFDDNTINFSKWTEVYANGSWDETNKRTEFTLYEHPGASVSAEGIESPVLNVTLSMNQSVSISWHMNTDIGGSSNCWSGSLIVEVIDSINEDNRIQIWYNRGSAATAYTDSVFNFNPKIIRYYESRYDGAWNNEIQIFSNRYHIVMNNISTGWVYNSLFPSDASLKLRIYIGNSGAVTPNAYMKVAFDNIRVEIPEPGKQAPYPPRIDIIGAGLRYISTPSLIPLKKYKIEISATDPDLDDVYLYIEWKDNLVGQWIGPVSSDEWKETKQSWRHGQYTIRIKAIDVQGYESILKEQVIKVSWLSWFINLIKNLIP